ncbi:P-loop containing nucleoside triphosphate hydrolase protein [Phlebopus sp. FC_14]|nr:P-loop containing nucleoside triphosphate hydrolase protein [Phlebopus sp. FC_14]
MPKKKKTQLKPVARGFATTSVPKRIAQVEKADRSAEAQEVALAANSTPPENSHSVGSLFAPQASTHESPQDDFDADQVEEQSLQNLVDKYQEKTEKEISRIIKGIEVDRRISRDAALLPVDPALVDRVIKLHLQEEASETVQRYIDQSEEKAVTRLAITYGVLRRLRFTEDWVERCLRAIRGVGLDDAYEWLYIHCPLNELEKSVWPYRNLSRKLMMRCHVGQQEVDRTSNPRNTQKPGTLHHKAQPTKTQVPKPSARLKLDANAPEFVPSLEFFVNQEQPVSICGEDSMRSSKCSSPEADDPNMEYARLKMQIVDLSSDKTLDSNRKAGNISFLEAKLHAVRSHYFFDERDAESLYRLEREKVDAQMLQARLRGSPDSTPQESPNFKSAPSGGCLTSDSQSDIFDQLDDSSAGLLEILDTVPSQVEGPNGSTIRVRSMAFPRGAAKLPKSFFLEYVSKIDRYAAVAFEIVSGGSRAKRARVRVSWEGRKSDEWSMQDIACHDESQAEQYIATVALHALSFPPTEGFASGSLARPSGHTFFRLFPSVFRDLWDELEAWRKETENRKNRKIWAKLRSIVEQKIDITKAVNGTTIQQSLDVRNVFHGQPSFRNFGTSPEQLKKDLQTRQMRPAYREMLAYRNSLPIARYRDEIIATLESSQVLVLCGETGCGKSTQVPSFILEDQLSRGKQCKIYCTEPRRISAVSLAHRVSLELGDPPGSVGTASSLVGYSIRLESNTSRNTRLAYVTNGIALRMLESGSGLGGQGIAFDDITHIIIDEVHERSIESDFLLVVLKSLLSQQTGLRIILMSATVDADKISNFFGGCPVLHVPGRTFPVDVRFLEDAVQCTGWSISEDSPYAKRSHGRFYQSRNRAEWDEETLYGDDDDETLIDGQGKAASITRLEKRYCSRTETTIKLLDERVIPYELIVRLLEYVCYEDQKMHTYSSAFLIFVPGLAEIRRLSDLLSEHPSFGEDSGCRIYPLHSTFSSENQNSVFDTPPDGTRKIVIATNIAETGITIPDITCVIDTGKHREMMFDEKRQLSRLVETFIARSNAAQRRGRAGRVQNGLCFHLFTKQRHDTLLAEHPLPEMLRLSLSDLSLRIKTMKVKIGDSIEDVLCRALDPPTPINVQRAVSVLVEVRALTPTEDITPMGRLLSKLPTDVHLGKFLLTAVVFSCLDPALTIAAALNSKSPFITPLGLEQEADRAKNAFRMDNSDFLTIHNAFSSWRRACANPGFVRKFCRKNFLSHENLLQIEDLRQQFLGYLVDASFISVDTAFVKDLTRARLGRTRNRLVIVPPEFDKNSNNLAIINAALVSGLYPKLLAVDSVNGGLQMRTLSNNQAAFFHPTSVNYRRKPKDLAANYLAYFTLMHSKKLYAWETAPMDDLAILLLCGECDFKLVSDTANIDRKIKHRLTPRANVALKILRNQLSNILAQKFRGKALTESQICWHELAVTAIGKVKAEGEEGPIVRIIIT